MPHRMFTQQQNKKRNKHKPWLENFCGSKIIYHEGGNSLILGVTELIVYRSHFEGKGYLSKFIGEQILTAPHMIQKSYDKKVQQKWEYSEKIHFTKNFSFKSQWFCTFTRSESLKAISAPGFNIWLRPDFVRYIEKTRNLWRH